MVYRYIAPLLLTMLIELGVLWLLGERRRKILVSSLIVNLLTNPAINYFLEDDYAVAMLAAGELLVVVVETIWYFLFGNTMKDALIYSALCNLVSYFSGNVIYFAFFYCFR